ncbi:MAG: glycosyltransferase [Cyanobacteria bacterium]|nr:glycosyltransferase [Cyanobacteriota bacterium]
MKVLHVIPSISPLRGGPSAAVLAMVAALRQQGVEASILTTNDHGPGIDRSMPLGRWFERAGVPVLAFGRWSPPLRPLREFAISPGLNRWLAAHMRDYQLLHVHALFSWPSTSAMAQARMARVPYVLRTIGQLNQWSLSQSAGRKQLLWRLIEHRNLANAAALHFTSTAERDQAAALALPPRTWVLPLGVQLPDLSPLSPSPVESGAAQSGPTFLFLSRIHPKKQLERLIDALALLQQRLPQAPWQLRIAGAGEPAYLQRLQQQIARAGIAHRCHWLGFLEGDAKWQAMSQADWFVLPSASENFGIAAIEALAAGTPTILSPGVALAEAITAAGAGRLCDPEPHALSVALEAALGGPPAAMRTAALDLAASAYGWPAIAARLENTYASLLVEHNQLRAGLSTENGDHHTHPEPTP